MSELGWREFLAAGLDDWPVLHGGAAAVFRVGSLGAAVRLVDAIARVPGFEGSGAILTILGSRVTVRLTRRVMQLEARHIDLARAISSTARELGATVDRAAVQEVQFAIAAKPDDVDVPFWRTVLGYDEGARDNGVDPLGHSSVVWLQELDAAKPLRHAMHIDVSLGQEQAAKRVQAAVSAGGRIVDSSNAPGSWILADRAGNKVCVVAWPDGAPTPGWTDDPAPMDE